MIVLSKKNGLMQAYGQSTTNNGARREAVLKGVWFVPHANANLFSV